MLLREIAHGRAGDKGDVSNVSVIARDPRHWPLILAEVTAERVAAHFGERVAGEVVRYELPRLHALNFVMRGALAGGVTRSLALDAHGKCLSSLLLGLEVDASGDPSRRGRGTGPATDIPSRRTPPRRTVR